jgi:hypothetical protein
MHKYIVLFLAPAHVMDAWMKTKESERAVAEKKMRDDWDAWMTVHASMIKETNAGGKTKRVTSAGVVDARNDIMLYSVIEAASHEDAAKAYEGHPHLGIPEASIEIMAIRAM